jgi:complex I assembly factor TIMMDC1
METWTVFDHIYVRSVSLIYVWSLEFLVFSGLSTTIAVYRGKSSMVEYVSAGLATGALYKFNMGLRGMAAGGLVGGFLGGIAGGISLFILRSTGLTMEEVRYWQYKWRSSRDDAINEGHKSALKGTEMSDDHLDKHDQVVGTNRLDIKILDPIDNKQEILKAAAKLGNK